MQLMHARYMAATGDLFLIASLAQMSTGQGSMFISLSVAGNAFTDALNVLAALPNLGDEDGISKFGTAVNDLASTSLGIYKTAEIAYDQINYLPPE